MKNCCVFKNAISLMLCLAIMFLLIPLGTFSISAAESSGTCGDNLEWALDYSGVLTVSGTGAMPDYKNSGSAPWYSVKASIKSVVIADGVTTVGNYAFYNYNGLTSVTVGNDVKSIGYRAFYYCGNLESITVGSGVNTIRQQAFYGCNKLNTVNITDIASWCRISFSGPDTNPLTYAHNLYLNGKKATDLVIPNNVTDIGYLAFYGCTGLKSVTVSNNVESIDDCAFYGCTGLKSVTIPYSLTSIGDGAFEGCIGLNKVNITDLASWCLINFGNSYSNPLSYAHNLYLNDELITDLVIPDGVTEIDRFAFYGCNGLKSVTIGSDVKYIDYEVFSNCSELESLEVAKDNENYYNKNNCIIKTSSKTLIYGCKNSFIPADGSVTSIYSYAFYGCVGLTNITLPNSITNIGDFAFCDCKGLETVYYTGFESEKEKIDIESDNNCLISAIWKYLLAGDANNDGILDAKDLISVKNELLSYSAGEFLKELDANTDGVFDLKDLICLKKLICKTN